MRWSCALIALALLATRADAQSTPRQDALLGSYFALWDNNDAITPENMARLYAPRIIYYGHDMSRADLLRDKINFVRRWPERHYVVEPGSASRACDVAEDHCTFTAVLNWNTRGAHNARSGRSRIQLTVARQDGGLKIVREGAMTLPEHAGG